MGTAAGHCEKVNAGVVAAAGFGNTVAAAPLAVRFHCQVTTLKVLFCFLPSPRALMGLVPSEPLRNQVFAQLWVWIPSLEFTPAEGVTDGDLWYEVTKGIQDSLW